MLLNSGHVITTAKQIFYILLNLFLFIKSYIFSSLGLLFSGKINFLLQ